MKKKIILMIIMVAFFLSACSVGKFSLRQCKEVTDTKTECMTTEIEGESDLIPF